jgi:D-tyrosyl-tRNA(Tyr) deacylase
MLALLQRVKKSEVLVDDQVVGKISKGLLVFLAVGPQDSEADCRRLSERIVNYRIFEDRDKKMNISLKDIGGEVLLVSQFTLLADTKKGMRPSFSQTASPQKAQKLYDYMGGCLRSDGVNVANGVFGARMLVKIENDGPVTFILESNQNQI